MLALVLKSAWDVYQGDGLAASVANAANDVIVGPITNTYDLAEAVSSKIAGALEKISDVGLREFKPNVWNVVFS